MGESTLAEAEKSRTAFYRKVIEKYSDVINAGEEKNIVQLKEWLAYCLNDPVVKSSALNCSAWESCVDLVGKIPHLISGLSVSFWLSPSDVLELNAGDNFDQAVFLQCILKTKGFPAKIRVIELDGLQKHALVCFEHASEFVLVEPHAGIAHVGKSLEDLLSQGFDGKKFVKSLYEVDQEEYVEF